jgi:hypothetical protein
MSKDEELNLIEKFKNHIHFEDGMDDSMLSFYLDYAKEYVQNATGNQKEYLVMMVASVAYEYRISEDELGKALDALTPLFIQEVFADGTETNE